MNKKNKLARVLVGCPVSDYHSYCTEEYLDALSSLTYNNHNILLVDNSKEDTFFKHLKEKNINVVRIPFHENPRTRIIDARNVLRKKVIEDKYDYFLSLEQDVIPPKDIIEKALSHKKEILTGVYCGNIKVGNKIRILPLVYKFPPASRIEEAKSLIDNSNLKQLKEEANLSYLDMVKAYYTIEELEKESSPTKIHSCGLGAVLISRKVLEKVSFRFSEKYGGFDDVWFCEDVKEEGFEIYVDPKIKCRHLIKNRPWDWKFLLERK
ncbi:hypothetical protein HYT56_02040 [Candidatus Woesearchaeota archaeon]|nr:hypothetical protein [Candidatus Woesearchaeota archaeon]